MPAQPQLSRALALRLAAPALPCPAHDPQAIPADPVAAAFDALIARLNEHALAADFDRAVRYRAAAISLRDRWAAGQMPRAPRKEAA